MAFKEEKKKAETVRGKIAESFIDAFGADDAWAKILVTDEEVATEACVDVDMGCGQSCVRITDRSALVEFFLDVQTRTGFEIPDIVIEHQFDLLESGRLRASNLIKAVEDAVTLGVVFKTPKEIEAEEQPAPTGHPGWEAE